MKYLVLGGCGFIGSHVVHKLIQLDHTVVVVDKNQNKESMSDSNITYIIDNIDDINQDYIFKDIDAVVHLAWPSNKNNYENNILLMNNCYSSTFNLLKQMVWYNIKKLIFISSYDIYGECPGLSEYESFPLPISDYGISKLIAEIIIKKYFFSCDIHSAILRLSSVYGANTSLYEGNLSLVDDLLNKVKNKEKIVLYNNGDNLRDFVHIDDVVDAIILSLINDNLNFEVFNIGSGVPLFEIELLKMISNNPCDIEFKVPVHIEPKQSWGNIEKAEKMLGWKPQKYKLFEYIKETIGV